jgi:hypothetical protein
MNFQNKARQHQENFRMNYLKLQSYDVYPTMLTDEDAKKGLNFCMCIPNMLDGVKSRYKGFRKPLYKNMLRSEHIPFNFFLPLQLRMEEQSNTSLFQALFPNLKIDSIIKIEVEAIPEAKPVLVPSKECAEWKYLDDKTSFDVLVTYLSGGKTEAIGIEVKYTEKSYPYGSTEKKRMFSILGDSLYHKTHETSKLFIPDSIPSLRQKELKQLWRNHLLGLKMIQKGEISKFTSVHMYPAGNTYQSTVATTYRTNLKEEYEDSFRSLTFEYFIGIGKSIFQNRDTWKNWIEYLESRYIH